MYKKVALHELGHLMGLNDRYDYRGPTSVMNNPSGKDDPKGFISEVVTICDADKAREAARRLWSPGWLDTVY
jgi:hypothetical protein